MLTDYHCHILPKMDDGSESVEMSLKMLEIMKKHKIERIIATPHFYAHREKNVESFLKKRQKTFDILMSENLPITNIFLGSEVAIEKNLSELRNIEELSIQGTNLILLEFPYRVFSDWMIEEIENISSVYKLTPVIAHIHRYFPFYSKTDYEKIMQLDAIFQINAEAFGDFRESRFVKKLIKYEFPLIFGSDAHNVTNRKPNFNLILKKTNSKTIESSNEIFEKNMG